MTLADLGWSDFFDRQVAAGERGRRTPARVAHEARERFRIVDERGEWRAELWGWLRHEAVAGADLPTVGDWVVAHVRLDDRARSERARFARQMSKARKAQAKIRNR